MLYMYQNPRRAKKLTFDVIPKAVDKISKFFEKYPQQEIKDQLNNPVFHIHNGCQGLLNVQFPFHLF